MNPQSNDSAQREQIIKAFDRALVDHDSQARPFNLRLVPDRVVPMYGGWVVPVASGAPHGSTRELVRTLDLLAEQIEKETTFDVSVVLDPSELKSGTHEKKSA
jgi:hypothetical protein